MLEKLVLFCSLCSREPGSRDFRRCTFDSEWAQWITQIKCYCPS